LQLQSKITLCQITVEILFESLLKRLRKKEKSICPLVKVKDHKFDVLGGSSIRIYHGSYVGGFNTGSTLFSSFERAYLSNSTVTSVSMSTDTTAANRQTVTNSMSLYGNANAVCAHASFFGRVNYSFKDNACSFSPVCAAIVS
jgi:hypothetical protein